MADGPIQTRFEKQFQTVAKIIADAANHELIVVDDFQDRIGVGATATVVIRRTDNARGFGVVWRVDRRTLSGLGARNYDGNKPDDDPTNRAFLDELERRLSVPGDTRSAVEMSAGLTFKRGWRRRFEMARHTRAY